MSNWVIDSDKNLGYETNSFGRKVLNSVLIPTLNALPSSIRPMLGRSHESAGDIIKHATTHKALEVLYGHSSAKASGNHLQRFFKSVWLSTNNSKAVRNRLKLVEREVKREMRLLLSLGKPIKIVSVASGSSRAITESIDHVVLPPNPDLSVTFVDKNEEAIAYSKELASNHKFVANFNWVHDTAGNFFRTRPGDKKFNIVEMVGLMDYFDDQKAINIFSLIKSALDDDGILITANIDDNFERPFITKAVGWNMIYRSADDLAELLEKAGFSMEKMSIYYEPMKIHSVIVARK